MNHINPVSNSYASPSFGLNTKQIKNAATIVAIEAPKIAAPVVAHLSGMSDTVTILWALGGKLGGDILEYIGKGFLAMAKCGDAPLEGRATKEDYEEMDKIMKLSTLNSLNLVKKLFQ